MCVAGDSDDALSLKGKDSMAEIKPFRGFRYRLSQAEELAGLVAPPYDMLDGAMVDGLYARNKHNVVRLTQNKPESQDRENSERHLRAAGIFKTWVDEKVVVQDNEPSVYIYEQRFMFELGAVKKEVVRTGVVVLVKAVAFEERVVLPHEATLSGPKKDRYELLDAIRANTGQIFGLIADEGDIYKHLRSLRSGDPVGVFTDDNNVEHALFRCSDQVAIQKLVEQARNRTILIADGHHRYETALNFYRDHPQAKYAYTMMTLVSMADPGLVIRPFHRLVRKAGSAVVMRRELEKYFTLTDCGAVGVSTVNTFLVEDDSVSLLFLDAADQKLYRCSLSSAGEQYLAAIMPGQSMHWKQLPVSMINVLVINTILQLPLDGHVLHDVVEYVQEPQTGIARCSDSANYYGGFFIRPTSIKTVDQIVAAGERMPQKSTNFFPKLFAGLVINNLDHA